MLLKRSHFTYHAHESPISVLSSPGLFTGLPPLVFLCYVAGIVQKRNVLWTTDKCPCVLES